jgi:hypothetical protein
VRYSRDIAYVICSPFFVLRYRDFDIHVCSSICSLPCPGNSNEGYTLLYSHITIPAKDSCRSITAVHVHVACGHVCVVG